MARSHARDEFTLRSTSRYRLPHGLCIGLFLRVTGGGAPVLQLEANAQPVHMFFSRFAAGAKVLSAACSEGGLSLDRGRLVGSPERLNLFTMDGDLLRVDLELDVGGNAQ